MSSANAKFDRMRLAAAEICRRIGATLDGHLGSGTSKEAFLITLSGASVALKVVELTQAASPRLQREIAALSSCQHPAIARILAIRIESIGEADYLAIAEEYLPGGTLLERLAGGPLSTTFVRRLGQVLGGALAHLAERNLVHRDIKPANILFRQDDQPVLSDFGLVRMLGEPSLTHDFIPQGPGTPLYAAPEQLTNQKALIDWRTDQFGLALVLAECLLGHPAFAEVGQSPYEAVSLAARRGALPAASRHALQSLGFEVLIKALSPWPAERYRRPQDFLAAWAEE